MSFYIVILMLLLFWEWKWELFGSSVCYIISLAIHLLSWYGIWGKRALFHLCHGRYAVSPLSHPVSVTLSRSLSLNMCMFYVEVCVHVRLSFWGYANCYADIIINSLGKQAGNKLGFEWVIVLCGMLHFCIALIVFSDFKFQYGILRENLYSIMEKKNTMPEMILFFLCLLKYEYSYAVYT